MAEQLTFDLPAKPALGREDFFVSDANAVAVATLEGWADWPQRKMALAGEAGAGKTHLAHVWATAANAQVINANSLSELDVAAVAAGSVVIEDADRIAGDNVLEKQLFHLHNLLLAQGHSLLLTGRVAPAQWPIALPDLKSRLQGTAVAALAPPDDALLSAVMLKLFADRQLQISPNLLPFLLRRIDRSFAAARATVQALDRAALAQGRPVTRILAAGVLDNRGEGGA